MQREEGRREEGRRPGEAGCRGEGCCTVEEGRREEGCCPGEGSRREKRARRGVLCIGIVLLIALGALAYMGVRRSREPQPEGTLVYLEPDGTPGEGSA